MQSVPLLPDGPGGAGAGPDGPDGADAGGGPDDVHGFPDESCDGDVELLMFAATHAPS